jgi:serine/threonine protein kinase/tetratricopeptide (TPR) repeat protein
MTVFSLHGEQPAQSTPGEEEALAMKLVEEMIQRWQRGDRPLPEDFLARHPQLWDHPEAAADLIYEEFCLRQEYGLELPVEQVLLRFPQWRPQLEVLFECQRLLGPRRALPQFPAPGDSLGDFQLLAELGRGAQGRAYLASQNSLGDRPVVLKLMPCEAREHLSLARLQHTHIVPLYSVQEHQAPRLRTLCMPYFGGATLAQLLEVLRPQPLWRRTGRDLVGALDRVQARAPLTSPDVGPTRQTLIRASYVEAVCWVGTCLADALQYAHERGLVHLDLKPSNVLLAADGQPMLLDFHLARAPIHPGGEAPHWLGGTAPYMSPEQHAALLAIQQGRKVAVAVDGRSDIYSLGLMLYEALGGSVPVPGRKWPSLRRCNPQVSVGLEDVIRKSLAGNPGDRYCSMSALAADLRRHLAHFPLSGVRNRSLTERYRKWRHRQPHGAALVGMMLAVLTAAGAVVTGAASHFVLRMDQASTALEEAQIQMDKGEWEEAITTLRRGLCLAQRLPFQGHLTEELERMLGTAEKAQTIALRAAAAGDLHRLTDRLRFLYGMAHFPPETLRELDAGCRDLWLNRRMIADWLSPSLGSDAQADVRNDLLDLAIYWADLKVARAPLSLKQEARREALVVLNEAETLLGPSAVVEQERKFHGAVRRESVRGDLARGPGQKPASHTAWEHYALGRSLLKSGDLQRADEEMERAVAIQPQGLWANFYQGLCAYRLGRYEEAAMAYSVCIGAAPRAACCFFNRALAFEALARDEQALRDYDQALRIDPRLAVTALNRGMLFRRAGRPHARAGPGESEIRAPAPGPKSR